MWQHIVKAFCLALLFRCINCTEGAESRSKSDGTEVENDVLQHLTLERMKALDTFDAAPLTKTPFLRNVRTQADITAEQFFFSAVSFSVPFQPTPFPTTNPKNLPGSPTESPTSPTPTKEGPTKEDPTKEGPTKEGPTKEGI
jgi:hypothetical protein